jgi:single-strand DNA-binding protein
MVNKAILVGNLGKDPEMRYTQGGQAICTLSLATSRSWTDKGSGQRKEETDWHTIEVWGKQAEACSEYLAKGRQCYVEGRIKYEKWQDKQTGQDKYRTKIVAENVRFLGGKGGGGAKREDSNQQDLPGGGYAEGGGSPAGGGGPDDIPF